MSFRIAGLDPAAFLPLFALDDDSLAGRGIVRRTVTAKPGFPCRITLDDAEPGERVLLLNHKSHAAGPYTHRYAIYVRECARKAADYIDALPPVLCGPRPLALRLFDGSGMLAGAELCLRGEISTLAAIERNLARPDIAEIHVHNAAHGCFAARVVRC